MFSATKLFVLAAAAAPAFATVYMTAPVGSTSWAAGTSQTITWQDDGSTPALGNNFEAIIFQDFQVFHSDNLICRAKFQWLWSNRKIVSMSGIHTTNCASYLNNF